MKKLARASSRFPCKIAWPFFSALLCSCGFAAFGQVTVVDVIPAAQSAEHDQNSEPSIAVNPLNPNQMFISAFGNSDTHNPVFFTQNGGSTWIRFQNIGTSDTTLSWSDSGTPFFAKTSVSGATLLAGKTSNVARPGSLMAFGHSYYTPGGGGPDQPWVFARNGADDDHIYVGFNDFSRPAKTASIRFSLNHGRAWRNVVIERTTPGDGSDGSPIRVTGNGTVVYAAFERYNTALNSGDEQGDLVVVKDTNAGRNNFTDLGVNGGGIIVAGTTTFPQGALGQERLGSDVAIAVDPTNGDRVFLAYATIANSAPIVKVFKSTNGGSSWSGAFQAPSNTALPALAIAANGTVGLLYTRLTGAGNLETHLMQVTTNSTTSDQTLSRFADNEFTPDFDPYIGDYEDLESVGSTFFGTFSASNNISNFPAGVTVLFQRDQAMLGGSVPFSIDPFFFSVAAQ